MDNSYLIRLHVEAMVPLLIHDLAERGGPDDLDRLRCKAIGQRMASNADNMMFRGGTKGEAGLLVSDLCFGLACLAFLPGGVKWNGMRFHTGTPDRTGKRGQKVGEGLLPATRALVGLPVHSGVRLSSTRHRPARKGRRM